MDDPEHDDFDMNADEDICRVCRLSGEDTLYHPCLCTGTIKYVHQKCLEQWLKYSKKEVCELCNHKFSFQPVYAEGMPPQLPVRDVLKGISVMCVRVLRSILTYSLVAFCWLCFVPLVACRVNKIVFSGSLQSFFSLHLFAFFSMENIPQDIVKGSAIVCLFVCAFIAMVWLREQIAVGGQHQMLNMMEANEERVPVAVGPIDRALDLDEEVQMDRDEEPAELPIEPGDVGQDENWGRDVERMVEDMTWQRLIGLDGSTAFLENVFWAISLNFVFNALFLYFPSRCGHLLLMTMGFGIPLPYFDTPVAILVGYMVIAQMLYMYHFVCRVLKWEAGTAFLMIKVFLLVTMELCLFPIVCGWWLDICSLPLTGSSLDARLKSFRNFPASSTVLHWLGGMLYVFYSASFILTLRGLLRPGVLWFIRNLNDPEFNPIQEMIDQPVTKHFRRLVASTSLFLSIIFLVVYIPLQLTKSLFPSLIPYKFYASDTPLSEFSMELLLLQVILPTILEYAKAYAILKHVVRLWCKAVSAFLSLNGYLLPNDDAEVEQRPRPEPNAEEADDAQDLAARHQAFLMVREPVDVQEYERPDHFQLRIAALIACLAATLVAVALMCFTIPVSIGRLLLRVSGLGDHPIHDMYTVGCGLYACWLMGKTGLIWRDWLQRGWDYVLRASRAAVQLVARVIAAAIPLVGLIPFLLGLYFQLVVISPLRVSVGQTPVFFPWKEWALGVVHFKIVFTTILMGPDWPIKNAFEQLCNDGVRGLRLKPLYKAIVLPMVSVLSVMIATPYVLSRILLWIINVSPEEELLVIRMSYPCLLFGLCLGVYVQWQWVKIKALCQRIRNEKYLIGTQLVNFYREAQHAST